MGHPDLFLKIKIPALSQSAREGWGTRIFNFDQPLTIFFCAGSHTATVLLK